MWVRAAVAAVSLTVSGCGIVGPSCVGRQQRGTVASLSGELAPGEVASHLVRYEVEGSQNDVEIDWDGQFAPTGPRLELFATRAECRALAAPPAAGTGPCALLGRAGAVDGVVVTTLAITHGRGNPLTLGDSPEYKLWLIGDRRQAISYRLRITWFFGPDC